MPSFSILMEVPDDVVTRLCKPGRNACRYHGTRAQPQSVHKEPANVCMRDNPILKEQADKFKKHTREGCWGRPEFKP